MFRMFYLPAITVSAILVGCSSSTSPQDEPLVTVTGIVTQIVDEVPVDGGVTITLEVEGGGTELLLFGSLFTDPPPDEETQELYQKILKAKVGNRVKATGFRGEEGIGLTDLVVLEDGSGSGVQ